MWYSRDRNGEEDQWAISSIEAEIRLAYREGEHTRALSLVSAQPIEAWFALGPDELAEILAAASPRQRRSSTPAFALDAYFRGDRPAFRALLDTRDTSDSAPGDRSRRIWGQRQADDYGLLLGGVFESLLLRRLGRPATAARGLERVLEAIPRASAPHESTLRFAPFVANEYGISLLLAGRLDEALRIFVSVHDASIPQLPFVVRDARVSAALIHAAFGDPRIAQGHLDVAASLPRTGSWYEAVIDVNTRLAEALLAPADESVALFDRLPTHLIGEFWPLLVIGEQILLNRAGRRHEAAVRLQQRVAAHPVPVASEGLLGSTFRLAAAKLDIVEGEARSARAHLEQADPELLFTRLFSAEADLEAGDTKSALLAATGLALETSALKQLDLVRIAVLAGAHLRRGRPAYAAQELARADSRWGRLSEQDLRAFPPPVRRLRVLAAEPSTEAGPREASNHETTPLSLTRREFDVLIELASGRNRKEIAARLFISENTVKTHQRSVFRKLDATSRSDAIGRAALLGLLSNTQTRVATNVAARRTNDASSDP